MNSRRLPQCTPEVIRAVLAELQKSRSDLHRSHRVDRCDLGVAMPGLRVGRSVPAAALAVTGDCVCRDLVTDVLHVVFVFVTEHGADQVNLPGAVRWYV